MPNELVGGTWLCRSNCPCFFFSSRRRHTRCLSDWSSDVCSSDLYKAQPLCLLANQPWAAQRATCRPLPSRIAIAPPLPVLNGYLSNDNHCCYCPGVGLLKEFNRAPTSPPLLVRSAGCE